MKKILFLLLIVHCSTFINPCSAQWQQTNGPASQSVNALKIHGSNIFAGTNQGVFLSTDFGQTWIQEITGLADTTTISSFALSDTIIFAGTSGGVYSSADSGIIAWNSANNGMTLTMITSLTVSNSDIYAGTIGGSVYLTTDNGSNWTLLNKGTIPILQ